MHNVVNVHINAHTHTHTHIHTHTHTHTHTLTQMDLRPGGIIIGLKHNYWYLKSLAYQTQNLAYPTRSLVYPTRSLAYPTRSLVHPMTPSVSQWNTVHVGYTRIQFALNLYISYFLCQFHLRRVADVNVVF